MKAGTFLQFTLFAAVGALGTAAHYVVLIGLVEVFSIRPAIASTAGFAVGAIVNYFLNYRFTFRSSKPHSAAMPKFLVIAGIGAILNIALMWLLAEKAKVFYLLAQVLATTAVLAWNYLGSRYWAFHSRGGQPSSNVKEATR